MGQDGKCQMGPYAAASSDTGVTKEQATKKKPATGRAARAKPTEGQPSYGVGRTSNHIHVKLRHVTRVARGEFLD